MISSIITYQSEDKRLPSQLEKQLSHAFVSLHTWERDQMTHRIQLIKEWRVEELRLYKLGFEKNPLIIKDISHISFGTLRILNLAGNQIESV